MIKSVGDSSCKFVAFLILLDLFSRALSLVIKIDTSDAADIAKCLMSDSWLGRLLGKNSLRVSS